MRKTIYYCDHCKEEVENDDSLTLIRLSIKLEREGTERTPIFSKDVCDNCLSEFGIVEDTSSKEYISNYCKVQSRFADIVKKFFKYDKS